MSTRRICIDGFNLAQRKGSGIATYGRNLNLAVRGMGFQTDILYGPDSQPGRNNLLNQVALNDASTKPSSPGEEWCRSAASPWGRIAKPIQQTGDVLPSPWISRAKADGLWACQDVFHTANRSYASYKAFTPLMFASGAPKPDLMHWTCPLPLKARGMPNVYTIHDMVPLRLPFTTLDNKRRFYFMCRKIARRADHIVTVSESARQDIIKLFGVSEDRITNTYQTAMLPPGSLDRTDEEIAREVEGIFRLPWKDYFLFFGAIEPKKNIGRLIEAYLASGTKTPLVIIGGPAWLDEDETRMLYDDIVMVQSVQDNMIRRNDRIRRYDYMPIHSLISLIRGAKATLFPSLYEGFGLPVLESMMLGTPVLTSTAGSLPEVAGEACVSVDPMNVDAIMHGILALDSDEGLRAELIARGKVQAAKFGMEAYQERLSGVYKRLI